MANQNSWRDSNEDESISSIARHSNDLACRNVVDSIDLGNESNEDDFVNNDAVDPDDNDGSWDNPGETQPLESVVDTYNLDPVFEAIKNEAAFLRTLNEPMSTRREGFTFLQETLEFIWGSVCTEDPTPEAESILNNALVKMAAYSILMMMEPES